MTNKLKIRKFLFPLISLILIYIITWIINSLATGDINNTGWQGLMVLIFFGIFLFWLIFFNIRISLRSLKSFRMDRLGAFSKILRIVFAIIMIGACVVIIVLTITLISLTIKTVSDTFMGIDWEWNEWQSISQTFNTLGGKIANSTNFSEGGNIEGFGQIFITIFVLGLIWSSTGIVAAILTRPKLS
ncbi:MAG: hypothetical protein ACRDCH_01750 [Metamycoplasmataceae bacterium]